MFWFLVGVAVGLLIGWNLLPQPTWVSELYEQAKAKLSK